MAVDDEEPWWKTCDLYDFVGGHECNMTKEEKDKYREEVIKPLCE